jgi:NAD(P)-dependent dehydrogenase (short-subunit alcohol dehydrogenase family)
MTSPVLVTGASSGIGLYTARLLAERGVHVFATVRSDADARRLAVIQGIEPVLCDVRSDADVARLREAILARGAGLWGLVNNAGVAHLGHLTDASVEDMQELFDINVFGVHRVTNAVVDLLMASRGRIVNMSSIAGTLSGPEVAIYSMSKHALESYTDSLGAQLRKDGVHVCAVSPGNFQSAILANCIGRVPKSEGASEWVSGLYQPEADLGRGAYPPPDAVARACYDALFDPYPHRRYLVTPDEDEAVRTLQQAAAELLLLNRGGSHAQTHEQLHAMLDEVRVMIEEAAAEAPAEAPGTLTPAKA